MIDFLKRQKVSAANCALTIFAHHIIERLGHECFQTEARLAGAKVHGKRIRLVIDDNHVIRGTTVSAQAKERVAVQPELIKVAWQQAVRARWKMIFVIAYSSNSGLIMCVQSTV